MKTFFIFCVLFYFAQHSEGIKNYMGTDIQNCLNCLCHARTGCYSLFNCANYSIDFDYWKTANSPTVDPTDAPEEKSSFDKCMKNENCILATLDRYVDAIGHMDCNCDGDFDCKDRFAIHLYGANCGNPSFDDKYVKRFNNCANNLKVKVMVSNEGSEGCKPEIFT
ncbi:uncharacterized protein LOC123003919 [Tribolium madens]|uniref:uncharacterized protein LOC123003919 n=1 Tax=Tribolium madens TaxID=41895 RepID=UPI001CF71D0F|nr:uncharacterized protein LOC123003919 [Tribolium madens]